MKFLKGLLVCAALTSSAPWLSAQVTLNMPQSTLGAVIKSIQSQGTYEFFCDDNLAKIKTPAVKVNNQPIEEVLAKVLAGKDVSYTVNDKIVYLKKNNAEAKSVKQAQTGETKNVTGQIVDENGEPLIGATIQVPGTSIGATTDIDGNFTLKVPEGSNITISYIGYQAKTVKPGNAPVNVTLEEDNKVLEEVVVTALGIKRASKALSYNAQEIKSNEITTVKDANFINSLSGKVAGVTINTSSSGVGGAAKVVMRGTKAIDQSSNALYVIDGVPMFNLDGGGDDGSFGSKGATEAIADINPEDIESMTVLTGAAAAALYGSHAANGAIVITTKRGHEGRINITLSQNTEILSTFRTPQFQNRYGTGDYNSASGSTERSWGKLLNEANYRGYDPISDFLRTGVTTTESITLSTGSAKNQTYASASVINSKGMVPNNDYNRYNFTFRNTTKAVNDKLTIDVSGNYIRQTDRNMVNQGQYRNPLVTAYLFPRGDDWNDVMMYERYDTSRGICTQYWPQGLEAYAGQNPYWIAYRNLRENKKDRFMLNGSVSYQVLDWLSLAGRARIDSSANTYESKNYATTNTLFTGGSLNGSYGVGKTDDKQIYADFMANVSKNFSSDWSLNANAGVSLSDMRQDYLGIDGPIMDTGLPNVFNVLQLEETKTKREQSGYHDQTKSMFASVELGYRGTYYLTATGRGDWTSQLAGENSTQTVFWYPSIGASVVLSNALHLPREITYLKLRGSFASVGLPFPRFLANPTYSWDAVNKVWQSKRNYPMYELKPEKTDSWEVGLTAKLFDAKVNFDVAYYYAKTYNQTFDPGLSVSSGYSTLYVQTGAVRNSGVELSLGYNNKWGNFGWNSTFVFSHNDNKILELLDNYKHPETGEIITKERLDVGGLGQARFVLKTGGSLGDLYSTQDLVRDANGNILVNNDGSVMIQNTEDIKLGSVFAKANLSWRNDFTWRDLNFGFMVNARLGGVVYSATQAALDLYGVSDATAVARDNGGVLINGNDVVDANKWYSVVAANSGLPQYYTYSATNVRLQEAHIGYTVRREKLLRFADLTVSLVGRNLWMIYCKAPFDPEAVATTGNYYQGIDNFMTPSARSFGFNVKLNF